MSNSFSPKALILLAITNLLFDTNFTSAADPTSHVPQDLATSNLLDNPLVTDVNSDDPKKRAMGLMRLGRSERDDSRTKSGTATTHFGRNEHDTNRGVDARGENVEEEKRKMTMMRFGKRDSLGDKRAMGMMRLGKRDDLEEEKRAMGMMRLGKREEGEEEKRAMGMMRLGKRDDLEEEKRAMGMMRLGKREDGDDEKRAMGLMRLGKRDDREEKRAMGMMRLGKREELDRDGYKRGMGLMRLGKRRMGLMRLGRRGMGMMRLGKREDERRDEDQFVESRFGESQPNVNDYTYDTAGNDNGENALTQYSM